MLTSSTFRFKRTDSVRVGSVFRGCLLGLMLACLCAGSASADKRVALVIGNSTYKNVPPLANPESDATDVSEKLTHLGFDVVKGINVDLRTWRSLLQQFERKAANADAAIFFFAGHGLQFQGQNYLMPTNAALSDETSLVYDMMSIDEIKRVFDRAHVGVKIMILDACRNNPLADALTRSVAGRDVYAAGATRGLPAGRAMDNADAGEAATSALVLLDGK